MPAMPTYPGYPGTLVLAKGNLPRGLQRLEEFIRLEEGADGERIENSECDEEKEDVGRGRGRGRWLRREATRGRGRGCLGGRHGRGDWEQRRQQPGSNRPAITGLSLDRPEVDAAGRGA